VTATNGNGLMALHSAVAKGHGVIARLLLSDSSLKHTIEEKLCHTSWPARYESIVTQNEDLHKPLPTKSICEAKFSDEMGAVCDSFVLFQTILACSLVGRRKTREIA